MPSRVFIACAKTDCKWNEEGQCAKSEIYVDEAPFCASYQPDMEKMLGQMLGGMPGGMAPDPRSMLVQQMASQPPIPGGIGAPPPLPMGGASDLPTGSAPPPLRF